MNTAQVSRESAERWHRFNLNYPELAERALHETIEGAIKVCLPDVKFTRTSVHSLREMLRHGEAMAVQKLETI